MRILLLLFAACAGHEAPTCEDVASHLSSSGAPLFGETPAQHRDVLLSHCTVDHWSADARACMFHASPADPSACTSKLTQDQMSAMTVTVRVPRHPDTPEPPPALVVDVSADGSASIAGAAADDDHLQHRLRELATRDPAAQVVIRADPNAAYAGVVHVMELAKAAGLKRLAISTSAR